MGPIIASLPPWTPDLRPIWRTPLVLEVIRKQWRIPAVGEGKPYSKSPAWLDAEGFLSQHDWNYEGHGDPQLPFECFTDFTYSREYVDRLRTQLEIEIFLMPDDDWYDTRTNFVLGRKFAGKNTTKG